MWVLEELGAWLTCLATFTDCVGLPSVLIGFACKWLSRGRGLLAIDSCSLWTESWRELGTLTSALLHGFPAPGSGIQNNELFLGFWLILGYLR